MKKIIRITSLTLIITSCNIFAQTTVNNIVRENNDTIKQKLIQKKQSDINNRNNNEQSNKSSGGSKFANYVISKLTLPTDQNFDGGTAMVEFIVKVDGSLEVVKITEDIGYGIKKQLKNIFLNCPKWKPGIKDGKPVEVKYNLPIVIAGNN